MRNAPPTEAEILDTLRRRSPLMTYVVKNSLNTACSPRRWSTPQILRHLKKLELAGKVERAPTSYAVMLCWRPVP